MTKDPNAWDDVRAAIDNCKSLGLGDDIDAGLDALHATVNQVDKTKEVQKWADTAMFASEPLNATTGPKVHLLAANPDPLGSIAAMALMYKGVVVRDLADVTDDQRREMFTQIQQTKLKAPFEAVQFHWMLEGVTRSFTHQMVRQRTAVFAQESLRFAVVEDGFTERVALPPSLAGTRPAITPQERTDIAQAAAGVKDPLWQRVLWDDALREIESAYTTLVSMGMPAEDARGLLPHNITTRLNYVTNLRNFQDHGGARLCTQSQFEWRAVWIAFVQELRRYGRTQYYDLQLSPQHRTTSSSSWQFDLIADMFRPACYLTGKCEFAAMDLDRKCKIRDRVDANAKAGRPSSEWAEDSHRKESRDQEYTREGDRIISAIHPREWLTDPGAAR